MKNQLLKVTVIALCLICFGSCKNNNEYNILDYGAINDTTIVNTVAVQKAIDKCAENGGKVIVPSGKYVIGTINLKSNVELHIQKGAELLGSLSLKDYSTKNKGAIEAPAFNKSLLYAENAHNIKITGQGLINGRGTKDNFPVKVADSLGERPMLMRFINCNYIEFKDVSFLNSASWCVHMVSCENITVKKVTIDSRVNINNDGFDLDGCTNILIEDCDIKTGDDAICPKSTTSKITENMVVKNCRVESHTAAFKCGTSSRGGFRNIKVSDCDFSNTRMGAIKLLQVDGGILEDITIENITMNNIEGPLFIRLGNRGRIYDKPTEQIYNLKDGGSEGAPTGSIKNITIRNIKATVVSTIQKRCGIMITGIPGHYVENVLLENITISYPGGGTEEDLKRSVPEDIARYPEQFFFGVLPSWGAYIRHAKNIEFKNVIMTTRNSDAREKIALVDVVGFTNIASSNIIN
ncbi:glycoside hydrolase family 28 protein [Cellulophaga sp. L1A9]|uniref:glycoside hydrolase family 28 protein n=1 Tax=Cellulophaga sp. L1A9 TaxID=2686362 RepID=UPI00131B60ED|nr:glycosyl hydrolase family 28 protein [Cellulophaga sp. L1A9]